MGPFHLLFLKIKSYVLNYHYIPETSIETLDKDLKRFNENEFRAYSFPIFQRLMKILFYRYDKDRECIETLTFMCNNPAGFDINQKNLHTYYQNTELMYAISCGKDVRPEASLILLKKFNANPFITDKFGKNALHLLLFKGHKVQRCLVFEILNHKDILTHINDQTQYGDTVLHIAHARRDKVFMKALLERGADLTIQNNDGYTPNDLYPLSAEERLNFLSKGINLRPSISHKTCNARMSSIEGPIFLHCIEPADTFFDVATINKKIFNSGVELL